MKGLVLAGGAGSRLRPLTYTGAKQLVPVANRPILFYVLDNLADAAIRDIGIVVSPETGAEVRAAVGDGRVWNARITYILQPTPSGLAHAVKIARPFLDTTDFCMFLGDNLVGTKIARWVDRFRTSSDASASLMLKDVPNPSQFGVAEVSASGELVRLVEKPKEPRGNLAVVGIYLFRKAIFDAIERIQPSARGELEITEAIMKLMELHYSVLYERLDSWWLDTGKKDDLLLANDTVLDAWLVHDVRGTIDASSRIMGRIRVESGVEIVRSTIRGPVTIGARTRVIDSHVGPFTSIGDDVLIERSGVDRSVIMSGSQIRDISRLEESLIGRRVVVHPGATRQGALNLLVGDDCRVELGGGR